MIRLNRTTEYGLMALRHMSKQMQGAAIPPSDPSEQQAGSTVTPAASGATELQPWSSAREIAEAYHLPFEITAKTLQRLKDAGWIRSAHGARGGYLLNCTLSEVSFLEFLQSMEGPQGVVACSSLTPRLASGEPVGSTPSAAEAASSSCEYGARCEIKHFMGQVHDRILHLLAGISLAELLATPPSLEGLPMAQSLSLNLNPKAIPLEKEMPR